jgi:hypothetical protein
MFYEIFEGKGKRERNTPPSLLAEASNVSSEKPLP